MDGWMVSNQYIALPLDYERFIANVSPCFLQAVQFQFSFGLLCMALLVLKNECSFLKTVPSDLKA